MENQHQDKEIEPTLELGSSLEETLKSSGVIEVGASVADLFTAGLPIFTALVSLRSAPRSLGDYFLAKKLVSFLSEVAELSPSDRAKMVDKLEREPEYAERVGDQIILLLDRLDDLKKPVLMARAFKAYCEGHIDGAMLARINRVIHAIGLRDLLALGDRYLQFETKDGKEIRSVNWGTEPISTQSYLNAGLAYVKTGISKTTVRPFDELCIAIIKHVLKVSVQVRERE